MGPATTSNDVQRLLARASQRTEAALEQWLPAGSTLPTGLHEAMRYAVFGGGKRLRPALVLASAEACGRHGGDPAVDACLAAVECLHTYTLVHDDLPAMDDDDLRRGRPTCHKAFGEATAILAGDALQAQAFLCLASVSAEAVAILARAASSLGVVGGQQEDLDAAGAGIDRGPACRARLERIHRGKTAALIRASCELGAEAARAPVALRAALSRYGEALGLAFQIADDVLDATASITELGKTPGKDAAQGKLTYVAVMGLDGARAAAAAEMSRAIHALDELPEDASGPLLSLARFVVERRS